MEFLSMLIPNSKLTLFDLILLISYAVICILIGIISSRHQKDDDYLIAGRKLGIWGFMASVVASYIGGAAIVAFTAYVYQYGISAMAVFIGTSIGFLLFIPYAKKLRRIGAEKQLYTFSDWFYYKFNTEVGLLSAIILFIVYFGMLLNQFIAGSTILAGISGWSYETALLFSSLIISIYLFAGGFRSVIKTDIFQYIVLFVVLFILAFVLNGGNETTNVINGLVDFSDADPVMTIAFLAFGIFIVFQSSEYWQRVYAAKSERVVSRGLRGSALLTLITGFVICLVGLAAHYHVPGIEPKEAFAQGLTVLVPSKYIVAGLILIFAAIMSSADTQIFVLASSAAMDFFGQLSHTKSDQKKMMRRTRLFIVLFSLAGFAFAYNFRDLVAVFIFITGIGFTILPAAIASFHWKIKNQAAMASFIAGILYVIILVIIAGFQPEPLVFFKDNADLAIGSIVVSCLFLLIFQQLPEMNGLNSNIKKNTES
ncbi:MAG: sodium:solute symporter family protein [Bacteroidales bacterium]|nr:sodium:solute symporter family protein [Bacteroidales bacterium]MDD3011718.1 sodium:solute symporter family protein [Bacteroidales bacterium]MDD3962026.1 sodium:solute symporter family protein [Bacteroidales bacterium]MDY0286607.1 sodium:solute symporter family protein [Bacteroidales bacterium]